MNGEKKTPTTPQQQKPLVTHRSLRSNWGREAAASVRDEGREEEKKASRNLDPELGVERERERAHASYQRGRVMGDMHAAAWSI